MSSFRSLVKNCSLDSKESLNSSAKDEDFSKENRKMLSMIEEQVAEEDKFKSTRNLSKYVDDLKTPKSPEKKNIKSQAQLEKKVTR